MNDERLEPRFSGRRVLVAGSDEVALATADRLARLGSSVVRLGNEASDVDAFDIDGIVDDAIVSWPVGCSGPSEVSRRITGITSLLRSQSRLARLVVVAPTAVTAGLGSVTGRLLATMTIYTTVHTVHAGVRINALLTPARPRPGVVTEIGNVALMLLSGLLDAMRGQVLEVSGSPEASP